ncbi:ComEA family DNA-binding protein [Ornithobacterium rhinotracheale]|uniref:ComEA family DNA-binding protein n=1 Tax=Ornithobacterium rhinotracheale TaxID=28251 RepID=UPI001FF1FDFA|nr:helix-hairpin-helix domain-containing protein [Ornithobacterium rhinotracheale]MCK0206012.1 helix-hairpin-helix domain-containing protein [Ornithobacterium rhinotracheale]
MRDFFQHFSVNRSQRVAFLLLCFLVVVGLLGLEFMPNFSAESKPAELPDEVKSYLAQTESLDEKTTEIQLEKFNPNVLDAEGFQRLGFSKKQAEIIVKYRFSLGGNFHSAEEFANCFVVSEAKFKELLPYIELREVATKSTPPSPKTFSDKKSIKISNFNPNTLDQKGWEQLGFSEKQAQAIIKYRDKILGGEFENLQQIKDCYVINDFKFNQIKDFITLPKTKSAPQKKQQNMILYPNEMTLKDWLKIGFSEADAKNILKFRGFMGKFESVADLEKLKIDNIELLTQLKNQYILKFD